MLRAFLTAMLLAVLAAPGGGHAQQLVNLGRLGDTVVEASSVNGGRELDNGFYGVLNLFDGGEHFLNGINYTYWLSDAATRHWVKLRFAAPVEVRSVLVEFGTEAATEAKPSRRPEAFALDIKRLHYGEEVVQKLVSVKVDGFRVVYPFDSPLLDVVELTLVFPGHSMIEVHEIEVMGIPSVLQGSEGQGPRVPER